MELQKKFIEQFIKPNLPKNKKEWAYFIIVILIVISLGTFTANQYLGIRYKAQLLLEPCYLCEHYQEYLCTGANIVDISKINFSKWDESFVANDSPTTTIK